MKLKNVIPIIAMLLVVFITGCKKDDLPGIRPVVSSTDPINEATSISINSKISATFSMDMNPSTITTTNFTLKKGTAIVLGTVELIGKMATFTATENLSPNTIYTATISTGVKSVSGESLGKNYVWTFTTSQLSDLTPPTVTLSNPVNSAIGVSLNHLVVVTFSEPMDPLTISALTFTLKQGSTSILGTVVNTSSTATFTPTVNLEPNKIYTATVSTAAKDLAGNALASNYTFSFTTGDAPDTSLPMVNSTDPLNNATGVALNKVISLTFSEAMDASTINTSTLTLKQGNTSITGIVALNLAKTIATFTPASPLAFGLVYTATISTGAKDLAGNALAANTVLTFTTVTAPPTVSSTDPLNLATGVALNKVVSATFNTAMDASTITSSTFTLMDGSTPVLGVVNYSGSTATFTPNSDLLNGKVYTAKVSTGAKSVPGISLVSDYSWTFTTVFATPTVLSVDPLNLATDVALGKVISANFSAAMDQSTITTSTFTLKDGTTPVLGVVNYSGTTATFTPSSALLASKTYTATITTGAKSVPGISIANNYVWSFTTVAAPSGLAVVDLGAAGNYVILAKTAINNTPTSAITGDLGLSPAAASFITGFALTAATGYATASQVTGQLFAADMAAPTPLNLTTAVNNMITAYNDAAGRPTPDFLELGTGNIGGKILTPGLYKWTNTVTLPSDVTISGGANDVWIFQIAGDLSMSNAVNLNLIGGAQAKNIFWQVAGQATFGTTSHFEGIILSMTSITFQTGASFKGRALAQTAVVLDGNAVTLP